MIVANFCPVQTSHQTYAESDAKFNGVKKKLFHPWASDFVSAEGLALTAPGSRQPLSVGAPYMQYVTAVDICLHKKAGVLFIRSVQV